MNRGLFGQYTYISMTKIDIWEHGEIDIKATAIHEYIHSYLVRSTLYGNFMLGLDQANKVDKKYVDIIRLLYLNEEKVQEATATLIELIYIWYMEGYEVAIKTLNSLPQIYKKWVCDYKHIFNKEYVINIYNQYILFSNNIMENYKDNNELCKGEIAYTKQIKEETEEKTALNLILFLVLKTSELALTIDMSEIDEKYWSATKKLQRYINNQYSHYYYPNGRFKEYMKNIFPKSKEMKSNFNLVEIVKLPMSLDKEVFDKLDNYILQKYDRNIHKDNHAIKNRLKETINVAKPSLNTISKLEKEAVLYAYPYPLNLESINKLFDENFLLSNQVIEEKNFNKLYHKINTLHIHPAVGEKEIYEYSMSIGTIINSEQVRNKSSIKGDLNLVSIISTKKRLWKILKTYKNDLYLTGCPRSEHILDNIMDNKYKNKVYINPATSLTSSLSFINKYFKDSNSEYLTIKYGDMIVIKKNEMVYFQLLLPGSKKIIDKIIEEKRLHLKRCVTIRNVESSVVNKQEMKKIELFLEEHLKSISTFIHKQQIGFFES